MGMILVTGGAGYVGSHIARALLDQGFSVLIADDLSTGFKENIPEGASFVFTDLRDPASVYRLFSAHPIEAVIHCAAKTSVSESEKIPEEYFRSNVQATLTLCQYASHFRVKAFLFSSTAAVYGSREESCDESMKPRPESRYGETKLQAEELVLNLPAQINRVVFRYFNVCGASKESGDRRDPVMLIPLAVRASLQKKPFTIWGVDYATLDGSCVRDFIHIEDLARAHVIALRECLGGHIHSEVINLGSASGYSVKVIAGQVRALYGLEVVHGPRRPGDALISTANIQKARDLLGWSPLKTLYDSVTSEYRWQTRHK